MKIEGIYYCLIIRYTTKPTRPSATPPKEENCEFNSSPPEGSAKQGVVYCEITITKPGLINFE